MIGITLKPNALKKWANSLHICTQIVKDIADMRDKGCKEQQTHKEEMSSRIKIDEEVRGSIRKVLKNCIHPLKPETHPEPLVNIYTGNLAENSVNVFNALNIGKKQMVIFETSWPDGFYSPIKKEIKTMINGKRKITVGPIEIYNTEMIYARVMCLLSSNRITLEEVLKYELSPIPLSLFKDDGEMRPSPSKSVLKSTLQVEVSTRLQISSDAAVIDGCAYLWFMHWPSEGSVETLAEMFYTYITSLLVNEEVYLVFDKYYSYSIKAQTRKQRAGDLAHRHQFSLNTPLPSKESTLLSSANKVQITDLISNHLIEVV